MESDVKEAMALIKGVYEDNLATINGRDYSFINLNHKKRLEIFAFLTGKKEKIARGDFSFMATEEWNRIAVKIENSVLYDGELISKRKDHWEEFPSDYAKLMLIALQAIRNPLL
jgi:hypothetical protein